MAIVTRPATNEYRDNWAETFGGRKKAPDVCECRVPGPGNGNSKCMAPMRAVCQCTCHKPPADEIPRRARIDLMSSGELAIMKAIHVVEQAGADVRLTEAIILLGRAKDHVADFVDNVRGRCPERKDGGLHLFKLKHGTLTICSECGADKDDAR